MSDKELIEVLKKIHLHCGRTKCDDCKFYGNYYCQISWLTGLLAKTPHNWNMNKIEEVICK